MSVMEMSHRSKTYQTIIDEAGSGFTDPIGIPDNYKVLFLQGGASQQFAMIPMNLMKTRWPTISLPANGQRKHGRKPASMEEANKIASSEDKTFSYIPDCSDLSHFRGCGLCLYLWKTIPFTVRNLKHFPTPKERPWLPMCPSCFLSEPVDITKYGIMYGGVQKNIGPAGVVIAIIREDLITEDVPRHPYHAPVQTHADAGSLYNPLRPMASISAAKVFKWLKKMERPVRH